MSDDFVIVDRPREARRVVSVPGRFSFADVRNARGERRVFGCHAVNPTPHGVLIASPVSAKMDARVIADIDHLGKVDGMVMNVLQRGFVMSINAKLDQRRRLAAKIEWLEQHKNCEVREQWADSRFIPKNPYSRMLLADGHVEDCLILDLSISGAAISANTIPAVGTVLAIGSLAGRVVRHFDEGFAVRFVERQGRDTVEMSLTEPDV
jgi:hypothetical protein